MSRERASGRVLLAAGLVVVAVGAALRLWGIDQGLPFPNARPDEREALEHTIGFATGDMNPRWFVYPNLFFWLVWGWEEWLLALRRMVTETPSYGTMLTSDLPTLLLYGRLLSALIGTATVALVWFVGRRVGGATLGLIAGIFTAVNFIHVRDSHALKADVFLTLGVLASLWLLALWVERRTWLRDVGAGVAIGVTTACKYPGILLLASAYHAAILASPARAWRRFVPSAGVIAVGTAAIATFLVCSPYLALDFPRAYDTASFSMQAVYGARPEQAPAGEGAVTKLERLFARRTTFAYHATVSLRHGCGLVFALLTVPALAVAFRTERHPFLVLAAGFSLFYYLAIGISPVHQSRYLTPLVPLLALLVADAILRMAALVRRAAPRRFVVAGLALAVAAEPAVSSVRYDRLIARTDTRVLATQWMAEHLPPGAVVAELGSIVFAIADPVVPPNARKADVPLAATDLARYGVTHVLVHEHQLPFSKPIGRQMQAIQPHLRLLATFNPYSDGPAGAYEPEDAYYVPLYDFDGVERPGPLVRIYAYEATP